MKSDHAFVPFLAAEAEEKYADGVILGCPYEDPGAFRHGAKDAPAAIRDFSHHISSYHPDTGRDLARWAVADKDCLKENEYVGSAEMNETAVFSQLEETAFSVFRDKRFLLTLGGTRAISYPLIKAAKKTYPKLKVISLDAHTGREKRGEYVTHDNVFTSITEDYFPKSDLYQWGSRVGSEYAVRDCKVRQFYAPPHVKKGVLEQMHKLYKYPVYLTIDIDVMDPPFAPGSGHPVYGGIGTAELFETIALLQSLNVVGMDLTEIVPAYDKSGITGVLGATIVKEALIHFLPKFKKRP